MVFPTRNEQQKILTAMKTCHVVRRRPDTIAAFAISPTKNKVVFFLETQMFVDAREHNFQASLKITAVELFVNTSFHRAPLFSRFLWHACVETSHHKKAAIFGTCVLRINGFFETIRIGEFAFERISNKIRCERTQKRSYVMAIFHYKPPIPLSARKKHQFRTMIDAVNGSM